MNRKLRSLLHREKTPQAHFQAVLSSISYICKHLPAYLLASDKDENLKKNLKDTLRNSIITHIESCQSEIAALSQSPEYYNKLQDVLMLMPFSIGTARIGTWKLTALPYGVLPATDAAKTSDPVSTQDGSAANNMERLSTLVHSYPQWAAWYVLDRMYQQENLDTIIGDTESIQKRIAFLNQFDVSGYLKQSDHRSFLTFAWRLFSIDYEHRQEAKAVLSQDEPSTPQLLRDEFLEEHTPLLRQKRITAFTDTLLKRSDCQSESKKNKLYKSLLRQYTLILTEVSDGHKPWLLRELVDTNKKKIFVVLLLWTLAYLGDKFATPTLSFGEKLKREQGIRSFDADTSTVNSHKFDISNILGKSDMPWDRSSPSKFYLTDTPLDVKRWIEPDIIRRNQEIVRAILNNMHIAEANNNFDSEAYRIWRQASDQYRNNSMIGRNNRILNEMIHEWLWTTPRDNPDTPLVKDTLSISNMPLLNRENIKANRKQNTVSYFKTLPLSEDKSEYIVLSPNNDFPPQHISVERYQSLLWYIDTLDMTHMKDMVRLAIQDYLEYTFDNTLHSPDTSKVTEFVHAVMNIQTLFDNIVFLPLMGEWALNIDWMQADNGPHSKWIFINTNIDFSRIEATLLHEIYHCLEIETDHTYVTEGRTEAATLWYIRSTWWADNYSDAHPYTPLVNQYVLFQLLHPSFLYADELASLPQSFNKEYITHQAPTATAWVLAQMYYNNEITRQELGRIIDIINRYFSDLTIYNELRMFAEDDKNKSMNMHYIFPILVDQLHIQNLTKKFQTYAWYTEARDKAASDIKARNAIIKKYEIGIQSVWGVFVTPNQAKAYLGNLVIPEYLDADEDSDQEESQYKLYDMFGQIRSTHPIITEKDILSIITQHDEKQILTEAGEPDRSTYNCALQVTQNIFALIDEVKAAFSALRQHESTYNEPLFTEAAKAPRNNMDQLVNKLSENSDENEIALLQEIREVLTQQKTYYPLLILFTLTCFALWFINRLILKTNSINALNSDLASLLFMNQKVKNIKKHSIISRIHFIATIAFLMQSGVAWYQLIKDMNLLADIQNRIGMLHKHQQGQLTLLNSWIISATKYTNETNRATAAIVELGQKKSELLQHRNSATKDLFYGLTLFISISLMYIWSLQTIPYLAKRAKKKNKHSSLASIWYFYDLSPLAWQLTENDNITTFSLQRNAALWHLVNMTDTWFYHDGLVDIVDILSRTRKKTPFISHIEEIMSLAYRRKQSSFLEIQKVPIQTLSQLLQSQDSHQEANKKSSTGIPEADPFDLRTTQEFTWDPRSIHRRKTAAQPAGTYIFSNNVPRSHAEQPGRTIIFREMPYNDMEASLSFIAKMSKKDLKWHADAAYSDTISLIFKPLYGCLMSAYQYARQNACPVHFYISYLWEVLLRVDISAHTAFKPMQLIERIYEFIFSSFILDIKPHTIKPDLAESIINTHKQGSKKDIQIIFVWWTESKTLEEKISLTLASWHTSKRKSPKRNIYYIYSGEFLDHS